MNLAFLNRALSFAERKAITSNGKSYTYDDLIEKSSSIAGALLKNTQDLNEACIAYLIDPSFEYTATQWGIWKAGGIAVPLCTSHPLPSIKYVLEDTQCRTLVIEEKYKIFLQPLIDELSLDILIFEQLASNMTAELPVVTEDRKAMILYTSGTTNLPKGVVSLHKTIKAQITTLVDAWEWSSEDHILNILPLHHVHGIINVMSCALWSGACCEFLPKFDAEKVWSLFEKKEINVFMAVPTIYYKLITYWDNQVLDRQKELSRACAHFRLMVSGSAALPVSVLEKWKTISGLTLLERYGMTEIGMGLSNSYRNERRAGHVGLPLPGVLMRLVDETGQIAPKDEQGEIQIKSNCVFDHYWQKPEATAAAFTEDGWFKTGDIAKLSDGLYKILGRTSIDIIKSGGYKISALEIEEVIRKYDAIHDCAVVGIPNEEWGEIIGAGLVLSRSKSEIDIPALKEWLSDKLPNYRMPRKYLIVDDLPRNTLGKVTKKDLVGMFL